MCNAGDRAPGSLIYFSFPTQAVDGTPTTLSGTPVVSVYKLGNSTESVAGVTLTVDYDSRTGWNLVAVDTSADGSFYAAGNDFVVHITTGTVSGISVTNRDVGRFSLYNWTFLRPATAGRTLVVDSAGLADANTVKLGPSGSGTAQTAKDVGISVPGIAAGASGGILISGSNSGTTTLGAMTVTGALTVSNGVSISRTSSDTDGLTITGNGTGNGVTINSGGGAGAYGLKVVGNGTGGAARFTTGSGVGLLIDTSDSSSAGISVSGNPGVNITAATAGNTGLFVSGMGNASGMSIQSGGGASAVGLSISSVGSSVGHGVQITSTAPSGAGILVLGASQYGAIDLTGGQDQGSGAGPGLNITGGGCNIEGGASGIVINGGIGNGTDLDAGVGVDIIAGSGGLDGTSYPGLRATGGGSTGSGPGALFTGTGTSAGMYCQGAPDGPGILAKGGNSSGPGFSISAQKDDAVFISSGSTSGGRGLYIESQQAGQSAIMTIGGDGAAGLELAGTGNGPGLQLTGGASGEAVALSRHGGGALSLADAILQQPDTIESGVTWGLLSQSIGALLFGVNTGANSGTEDYAAMNNSGTPRLEYTIDETGNRSGVTFL